VGTGVGADGRVALALAGALSAAGAEPRGLAFDALRVTAYADAAALPEAARVLHRMLFGA